MTFDARPAVTLTDFLLARIAEDEAMVQGVTDGWAPGSGGLYWWDGSRSHVCIETWRVLAECEAKRWMVSAHTWHGPRGREPYGPDHEEALRALAAVYADHEEYDASWKI